MLYIDWDELKKSAAMAEGKLTIFGRIENGNIFEKTTTPLQLSRSVWDISENTKANIISLVIFSEDGKLVYDNKIVNCAKEKLIKSTSSKLSIWNLLSKKQKSFSMKIMIGDINENFLRDSEE